MSGVLSGASGGGGMNASQAAGESAEATYKAAQIAIAEQRRQFNESQAQMMPWQKAGEKALALQNKYSGLGGVPAQEQAFSEYMSSPLQGYFKRAGTDALTRNQTALGGVGSDRVKEALGAQGAGWASQDYENAYNRLAGLSNTGQAAGNQLGTLGQNKASAIGNIGMQAGQSMASGVLAGQQADSAAKGQIAGAALSAAAMFF